jgi:outer membrane protein TolC
MFAATLAAAVAQTNTTARTLSLADCINEALKHNFDVQVERYEPQISLYDLHAAYGGYDPTFSISGTHDHNNKGTETGVYGTFPNISDGNSFSSGLSGSLPWGMAYGLTGNIAENYGQSYPSSAFSTGGYDNSGGSAGVSLRQPLLKNFWVDDNRVSISVAKNRLKFSEQGLRQQLIATVTAVENAFYELIYARENLKVRQQALGLAQTQLDQDKQRVQVGSLAPLDVQQDEAQLAQSRASLIAAQFNLATSQNVLKNLITDTYPQWHDVDIEPAETLVAARHFFDLQDSWSQGMTQRPDLLGAKLNVEQQGIQLRYSRNQLFPQLDLVGSYGFNGAAREFNGAFGQIGKADRPYYSYGAELSVPLSNVRARNSYRTSKVNEQQLLLRLKQLEQNVMVQIDNAVKQAQSAWESVDATRAARIYAEAALDAEQKKYAVGKSTTFTVLQLQNNLTSARSEEIRSLANYNEALANLSQQEGSTLQRHNLDVQLK